MPSVGETPKSKCRCARNSVLAGATSATGDSSGMPGTNSTGGTVTVEGVVAEPMWISGV